MTTYQTDKNWVDWTETFAKLIKSILDFESASASGVDVLALRISQHLKQSDRNEWYNQLEPMYIDNVIEAISNAGVQALKVSNESPIVAGLSFTEWLGFGIGMIDGAMGALPADSYSLACSEATIASREDLLQMIEDITLKERADAYAEFESMCSYAHPIVVNCYYGV